MDHAGKDAAAGDDDNGDLEHGRRGDQELSPAAAAAAAAGEHVSRGLAAGRLARELAVEGASSFVVVFWSCVAALMQEMHRTLSFPLVCLVVALTVAFAIGWLGPAHFNPAVTVTFAAFRRFPWAKVPCYAAAQLAGSVLACLAVNGVMRPREEHFYGTAPMAGHSARLPFLLELLASAVLMVVIATVSRASVDHRVGGLAIGAAVGTLGLVIGPVSGGSMNPVRTLGPAIVLGRYTAVWIYLVAPVAGMLLGALCNRVVRKSDRIIVFLCGGEAIAPTAKSVLTPRVLGAAVVVAPQH